MCKDAPWDNSLRSTSFTQVLFFALLVDVFSQSVAGDIIDSRGRRSEEADPFDCTGGAGSDTS
jgi:hypothetical protein